MVLNYLKITDYMTQPKQNLQIIVRFKFSNHRLYDKQNLQYIVKF